MLHKHCFIIVSSTFWRFATIYLYIPQSSSARMMWSGEIYILLYELGDLAPSAVHTFPLLFHFFTCVSFILSISPKKLQIVKKINFVYIYKVFLVSPLLKKWYFATYFLVFQYLSQFLSSILWEPFLKFV